MININVEGNSLVIDWDNTKNVFPLNSILLIGNDQSDLVNVRLKASRRNILTFLYQDVANITASSATDMCVKIGELSNK